MKNKQDMVTENENQKKRNQAASKYSIATKQMTPPYHRWRQQPGTYL